MSPGAFSKWKERMYVSGEPQEPLRFSEYVPYNFDESPLGVLAATLKMQSRIREYPDAVYPMRFVRYGRLCVYDPSTGAEEDRWPRPDIELGETGTVSCHQMARWDLGHLVVTLDWPECKGEECTTGQCKGAPKSVFKHGKPPVHRMTGIKDYISPPDSGEGVVLTEEQFNKWFDEVTKHRPTK
jgi:hypothetical protein